MIEANELMRGNELLYKGVSVAVRKIDDGAIYCCGGSDNTYFETGWKALSEFSPIPLTDEILSKIVWNVSFTKHEKNSGSYSLIIFNSIFTFKYLHQLQNFHYIIKDGEEMIINL